MNRSDLVVRMANAAGWSRTAADRAMRQMLGGMVASLKRGESVTLVGFGTFAAVRRRPRIVSHPRTGRKVTVAGRVPRFKPSNDLKQAVR
jgi:DNA-binding protein HU-beta